MYNIVLQAVGIGGILGATTSSIGTYLKYLPEALLAAVAGGFFLVWFQKRKMNAGASVGGTGGGLGGMARGVAGGGGGNRGSVPSSVNLMLIYSHVQRRVVGIRPFAVERKKDVSGNILEKRAVYLDTPAMNPQSMGRLNNVFTTIGMMFGRKPPEKPEEEKEGVLFTEDLAIGSPSGGWIASTTLEENAQIPIFPDISMNNDGGKRGVKVDIGAYGALADEIKRINSQYDKRISRLKDAALSINQYAQSANSQMKQLFGKELLIFGILLLVGILILAYSLGQLGSIISQAGTLIAAAKSVAP